MSIIIDPQALSQTLLERYADPKALRDNLLFQISLTLLVKMTQAESMMTACLFRTRVASSLMLKSS
jgi:hypothetical protein